MIWFKNYTIAELTKINRFQGAAEYLGFNLTKIEQDRLIATMPVVDKTKQAFGILHGGISCIMSETLGSIASWMCIDPELKKIVGIEINANHIKSVSNGLITGYCESVHIGRSSHIWQTTIKNDQDKLVAISRLTTLILNKK